MLLICALLFVPASLAKSCVMSAILGPKLAAGSPAEVAALARAADASGRALADAYEHNADPATITRLQHENQARLADVARASPTVRVGSRSGFLVCSRRWCRRSPSASPSR